MNNKNYNMEQTTTAIEQNFTTVLEIAIDLSTNMKIAIFSSELPLQLNNKGMIGSSSRSCKKESKDVYTPHIQLLVLDSGKGLLPRNVIKSVTMTK